MIDWKGGRLTRQDGTSCLADTTSSAGLRHPPAVLRSCRLPTVWSVWSVWSPGTGRPPGRGRPPAGLGRRVPGSPDANRPSRDLGRQADAASRSPRVRAGRRLYYVRNSLVTEGVSRSRTADVSFVLGGVLPKGEERLTVNKILVVSDGLSRLASCRSERGPRLSPLV